MTSIPCPLSIAAERYAHQTAVETPDARLDYRELDACVQLTATRLRRRGICEAQRVGVLADNSLPVIIGLWALFRIRAVACLLSPRWPDSAAVEAARSVGAEETLTHNDVQLPTRAAKPTGNVSAFDADDTATVVFSSGSTGCPKAIAHSLQAHLANAEGSNQNLTLAPQDRWLMALPLFHVSGLGVMFRCLLNGATMVFPKRDRPITSAIADLSITHVSAVPTQLKRMTQVQPQPSPKLAAVLLGGSSWPVEWVRCLVREGWPIFTTYGLTEMASQVTTTSAGTDLDHVGSSGRVLPGREVMIAEDGEILVRGKTLFQGYVLGDQLDRAVDGDGWFHTGDLGRIDEAGYLSVDGRLDNLFISGGENVYPEEIEARLLELDAVQQAIVVSIPNDEYGHRPVAFVDATELHSDVWRERLAEHLPRFKVPDHFLPWPDNDVNVKPSRSEFANIARQQLS